MFGLTLFAAADGYNMGRCGAEDVEAQRHVQSVAP